MPPPAAPSASTTVMFAALEFAMALVWLAGLRWAIAPSGGGKRPAAFFGLGVGTLVLWIGIPQALAFSGALDRWTMPAPAMVMIFAITAITFVIAGSPLGARLARLPLPALVGFQVFRVVVEILLHRLVDEGVIPVQMSYEGLNLDIVTGLTAAVVALSAGPRPGSLRIVRVWNVTGLLLLANIVAIAVVSTPTPFRVFLEEPANRLPAMPVFVALPTFLVQLALLGHLVTFRALARAPETASATA